MTLSGRNILITGASSGLGRHFAEICAQDGAKVALCARRTDRLEALEKKTGGPAIQMDVEDETSVIAGFDAAEKALGPIDGCIVNAGMNSRGMAVDLPMEEVAQI